MTSTALYRHFDAGGQLLYVGISLNAVQRLAQHRDTAHWFARLARVEVEWHVDREAALRAEACAIAAEAPLHNRWRPAGAKAPGQDPTPSREWRGWVIQHPHSGRLDGNYTDSDDAQQQLAWWCAQYPRERFVLLPAPGPARPELRPLDAEEWRAAE